MTNLNLQSVLLLVEVKTLNRESISSVTQHLLGKRNNETIRMHRSRTVANPRCALNIHAMLRIGSTLGQEIVYPKPVSRLVSRLTKQSTTSEGQPRPEERVFHDLVAV